MTTSKDCLVLIIYCAPRT